jgi:hypothetical protein
MRNAIDLRRTFTEFKKPALLLLLYMSSISSLFAQTEVSRPVTLANSVLAIYTEDWSYAPHRHPQLILGLWTDGHIVWSTDQIRGGPPYRAARIPASQLQNLLTLIETDGMFVDPDLSVSWVPLHSDFTTIFARWGEQQLLLRSRHEIEEVTASAGEEVPFKNRRFRSAWTEIRRRASALIPTQSANVRGELIQVRGELTWREIRE